MANRTQKAPKFRIVKINVREFSDIENDLNALKCSLTCACLALGQAQDTGDVNLGAKAWRVIRSCVEGFDRLEEDLDNWNVSHEYSLKGGVSNG